MKKILLIVFVFVVASCNNNNSNNHKSDEEKVEPRVTNQIFDPALDSLYVQCKDLKGLGRLHIGKTTLRQVGKDKGLSSGTSIDWDVSFVNGFWGLSALSDMEQVEYLNKNAKKIKQFKVGKYTVGELEIDDVCLAFYRDTLVAISFDCSDDILKHYISKYGNGKGSVYRYDLIKGKYGDDDYFAETKYKEIRIWANEKVSIEYKSQLDDKIAPNERRRFSTSKSCVISSNHRYRDFLNELEKYQKAYKEQKEAKTKASYDSL